MSKHIHFIGICGIAMGSLALAFKRAGYNVTGSDVGFYPPMSTHLKNEGIEYYPGWHTEKMIASGVPNFVIVGNVASSTNPEWMYIQQNHLSYFSYPEAIAEFFIKPNSIVCAGTYGKTTTSALLSFILTKNKLNPSYMFGGLTIDNFPSAEINNGEWSVMEGDEYKAGREDNRAKFFSYHPTHLLLTAIKWDHADIYPTEESYFNAFKKLTELVPQNGLMVISENVPTDLITNQNTRVVRYGQRKNNEYIYQNINQTKNGLNFEIKHQEKIYKINCPMIGEYNAENICGAFALACEIGILPEKIISSITEFPGLKRRLEKRGSINSADVYDDIAHSPIKAQSVLENLRKIYIGKIFAIFEPNTGNRQRESTPQYNNAFVLADEVIIPKLTKIKIAAEKEKPLEGDELAAIISKTQPHTKYIENDEELTNYLKQNTTVNDVVVFLGSHGFRGMIESITSPHQQSRP